MNTADSCEDQAISVILVTYNRSEKLQLAIRDILCQSFTHFELIICDDCSPDNTREICEEFAKIDNRVKYIRRQKNLGMPGNLNEGIKLAKFEYLAILHDADRYQENLLQTWYDIFVTNSSVSLVFFQHAVIDEQENIIHIYKLPLLGGVVPGKELLRKRFFRSWSFSSPVFGISMTRKSLVEKLNFFNSEYNFYSDVDMWMTLLHDWDAYYIDVPLVKSYYRQSHQFDDNGWRIGNMMQKMFLKHRYLEFANASFLKKKYELFLHYVYCHVSNFYQLALLLKHGDCESLSIAKQYLSQETKLLLPIWELVRLLVYFRKK